MQPASITLFILSVAFTISTLIIAYDDTFFEGVSKICISILILIGVVFTITSIIIFVYSNGKYAELKYQGIQAGIITCDKDNCNVINTKLK